MLPTHFASPALSSQHADDGDMATVSGRPQDGGSTYPPSPAASGSGFGSRRKMNAVSPTPPSNPVIKRVLGSRGIASFTIDTGPLSAQKSPQNGTASTSASASTSTSTSTTTKRAPKRGRWHTLEFKIYYLVFLIMVPLMVWVPVRLSRPSNPNYYTYSDHLKPGWIAGRLRDDSDFQYRSFRDYVPALAGIMGLYLVLSKVFSSLPSSTSARYTRINGASTSSAQAKPNRLPFLAIFTAIFIFALHGFNSPKLLLVLTTNYGLAKLLGGTRLAPGIAFAFNVLALFAVHWNDGFEYSKISPALSFLEVFKGLLPRWQINFNITMLRLVSFALDYHWAKCEANEGGQAGRKMAEVEKEGREATFQERTRFSQHLEEYSFSNYLLYALYPPLFIAGPIMTFNDFTHQLQSPCHIPKPPSFATASDSSSRC